MILRGLHTENGMVVGGASNSTTDQLIGLFFATPVTTIIASENGFLHTSVKIAMALMSVTKCDNSH